MTLRKQHVVTSRPIAEAPSTSMVVVQWQVWPQTGTLTSQGKHNITISIILNNVSSDRFPRIGGLFGGSYKQGSMGDIGTTS